MSKRILYKPFTILLITISCQLNNDDKRLFDNFQKQINQFNNHYTLGDTISYSILDILWNKNNFIDTLFLNKFQLIDTTYETEKENKIQKLKDYNCSFIGKYQKNKIMLLLSISYRIQADDGYPILTVTTISDKGELLDLLRIELETMRDAFYQPTQKFSISKDFEITSTKIEKSFKEDKDELILTDSTSSTKKYKINDSGHFISLK